MITRQPPSPRPEEPPRGKSDATLAGDGASLRVQRERSSAGVRTPDRSSGSTSYPSRALRREGAHVSASTEDVPVSQSDRIVSIFAKLRRVTIDHE